MKALKQTFRLRSLSLAGILYSAAISSMTPAYAQQTAGTDSIVALAADSQSLSQVTSAPQMPIRGGTYWWVYPGGWQRPLPCCR